MSNINDNLNVQKVCNRLASDCNHYQKLELSLFSPVSEAKKKINIFTKIVHPDKCNDPNADVAMKKLNEIRDDFKDEETKKSYDSALRIQIAAMSPKPSTKPRPKSKNSKKSSQSTSPNYQETQQPEDDNSDFVKLKKQFDKEAKFAQDHYNHVVHGITSPINKTTTTTTTTPTSIPSERATTSTSTTIGPTYSKTTTTTTTPTSISSERTTTSTSTTTNPNRESSSKKAPQQPLKEKMQPTKQQHIEIYKYMEQLQKDNDITSEEYRKCIKFIIEHQQPVLTSQEEIDLYKRVYDEHYKLSDSIKQQQTQQQEQQQAQQANENSVTKDKIVKLCEYIEKLQKDGVEVSDENYQKSVYIIRTCPAPTSLSSKEIDLYNRVTSNYNKSLKSFKQKKAQQQKFDSQLQIIVYNKQQAQQQQLKFNN